MASQRRPLHPLHGDERALRVLAGVVDGDDARMVEASRGARLAEQTVAQPGLFVGIADIAPQNVFQRDGAADHRVARIVDDAHAAAS